MDLAGGAVGDVAAAHHVGDPLRRVVHHHGQLVGPQAVGALQHEVADGLRDVLVLRAQAAVAPADEQVMALGCRAAQPLGARRPAVQALAAGAWVDQFTVAM